MQQAYRQTESVIASLCIPNVSLTLRNIKEDIARLHAVPATVLLDGIAVYLSHENATRYICGAQHLASDRTPEPCTSNKTYLSSIAA